ncbi:MAG TPA: nucleotidyltransferase family protein [Anaerolineales bacterium]|nr:nucleotidyltransferase family protein [Anaerolineales bacterium]
MISAIILAAGESKRMGKPKLLLPWGSVTVLEHVLLTYIESGLEEIVVITGGARQEVEKIIAAYPVRSVFNAEYANGEMLSSLQCGLRALSAKAEAALIGLGDQPQVRAGSVRKVCDTFRKTGAPIVVPSFQMRRGHPWLAAKTVWGEILKLKPPHTPREFLNAHAAEIKYVEVNDAGILADLDTPEDYRRTRPRATG